MLDQPDVLRSLAKFFIAAIYRREEL